MELKDLLELVTWDMLLEGIGFLASVAILWELFFQGGIIDIMNLLATWLCG